MGNNDLIPLSDDCYQTSLDHFLLPTSRNLIPLPHSTDFLFSPGVSQPLRRWAPFLNTLLLLRTAARAAKHLHSCSIQPLPLGYANIDPAGALQVSASHCPPTTPAANLKSRSVSPVPWAWSTTQEVPSTYVPKKGEHEQMRRKNPVSSRQAPSSNLLSGWILFASSESCYCNGSHPYCSSLLFSFWPNPQHADVPGSGTGPAP